MRKRLILVYEKQNSLFFLLIMESKNKMCYNLVRLFAIERKIKVFKN